MVNRILVHEIVSSASDKGEVSGIRGIEVTLPVPFEQLEDTDELGMIVESVASKFGLLLDSFCGSDEVDSNHELLLFNKKLVPKTLIN